MSVKTFYYYTATSIRQSYSYVYILIKFAVYHGTTPRYNTAVRRLNTAVQDFPRYPTLMHTHVSCTQMINVTRPDLERPWDTHFVYYMTFHGALVPAATAVDLASRDRDRDHRNYGESDQNNRYQSDRNDRDRNYSDRNERDRSDDDRYEVMRDGRDRRRRDGRERRRGPRDEDGKNEPRTLQMITHFTLL